MGETCKRCAGNGEIVNDWDRYLHPRSGDVGDEAVEPCPDCDGIGEIAPTPHPSNGTGPKGENNG